MELHPLAQVEGVAEVVVGLLPGLGEIRDGVEVLIQRDQVRVGLLDHQVRGRGNGEGRVHPDRIGGVGRFEHPALLHRAAGSRCRLGSGRPGRSRGSGSRGGCGGRLEHGRSGSGRHGGRRRSGGLGRRSAGGATGRGPRAAPAGAAEPADHDHAGRAGQCPQEGAPGQHAEHREPGVALSQSICHVDLSFHRGRENETEFTQAGPPSGYAPGASGAEPPPPGRWGGGVSSIAATSSPMLPCWSVRLGSPRRKGKSCSLAISKMRRSSATG